MDIDVVKKLIKKYEPGHRDFIKMAEQSERYYNRENDIKFKDREKKMSVRIGRCAMRIIG